MITPERRLQIEQTANTFGHCNGWTGTSGTLAHMIIELLREIKRLEEELLLDVDEWGD